MVFALLGCVLVLFIVLPLFNLVFTSDVARMLVLARDPSVQAALWVSLSAAFMATLIAMSFGVPLGYVLAREEFAGKAIVEGIVDVPVVIPHTIAGIALLFIFGRAGIVGAAAKNAFGVRLTDSYWGIVMAMLFVAAPFAGQLFARWISGGGSAIGIRSAKFRSESSGNVLAGHGSTLVARAAFGGDPDVGARYQ